MEKLSVFILICWHFAFFWRFYRNPNLMATSELLSNFFPQWLWAGRQWKSLNTPFRDRIYYLFPACIPFLSTFYPISALSSLLGAFLCEKRAFKLYSYMILLHYLLGSVLALHMLTQWFPVNVGLLGAISLNYNAYNIKIYTPCFAYTSCWIMGILLPFPYGALCFGMAILGGYWPILTVSLPVMLYNLSACWGALIGLPQLIPFLWYWPRSIRSKRKPDSRWGRMPWKRYFVNLRFPENGVHYPELAFGVGICLPLALYHFCFQHFGGWAIFTIVGVLGASGLFVIDRIPSRFNYLTSFSLIMASLFAIRGTISVVPMIILQCFLLWKWRYQYPHFPFAQWWKRKVELSIFTGKNWPNNTGYMKEEHHQDYFGGFALVENYHE